MFTRHFFPSPPDNYSKCHFLPNVSASGQQRTHWSMVNLWQVHRRMGRRGTFILRAASTVLQGSWLRKCCSSQSSLLKADSDLPCLFNQQTSQQILSQRLPHWCQCVEENYPQGLLIQEQDLNKELRPTGCLQRARVGNHHKERSKGQGKE